MAESVGDEWPAGGGGNVVAGEERGEAMAGGCYALGLFILGEELEGKEI